MTFQFILSFFILACISGVIEAKQVFPVAVEQWAPFTYLNEKNGNMNFEGPMKELLDILSEKLDIDYVFSRPPGGQWGVKDENGTWSGMLGMIQRGEVDFAVGPFMKSYIRAQDFDFAETMFTESYTIMMPRPKFSTDVFAFLRALESEVYVCTIVFLVGMATALFVVNFVERKIHGDTVATYGFVDSLIWVVQALFQEGTENKMKTTASRILMAIWLVSTLIFMKSYEGVLTSMLAVPSIEISIDSVEDLAAQNELNWRLEKASTMYQYFQEKKNPIDERIYNGHSGVVLDCFTACSDVIQGKYAAICDLTTILKCMDWDFSQHNKCNVYAARTPVLTGFSSSMVFRKNFTLLPKIDSWIEKLKQTGFFTHWVYDQLSNATTCVRPPTGTVKETEFKYLKLENFIGCFYIFGIGCTLGTFAFLIEVTIGY